jgi:hypothetical protein
MGALRLRLPKYATLAASATFCEVGRPLNGNIVTFLIEFIELWACKYDIAFPVHGNDFLRVFAHEKMLTKYDVVENAANTEDVTDGLRLS